MFQKLKYKVLRHTTKVLAGTCNGIIYVMPVDLPLSDEQKELCPKVSMVPMSLVGVQQLHQLSHKTCRVMNVITGDSYRRFSNFEVQFHFSYDKLVNKRNESLI